MLINLKFIVIKLVVSAIIIYTRHNYNKFYLPPCEFLCGILTFAFSKTFDYNKGKHKLPLAYELLNLTVIT